MNKRFQAQWRKWRVDEALAGTSLQPRLRELMAAPLVCVADALVLEPLAKHSTGPAAFPDATGYEAFANKMYVNDFLGEGEDDDSVEDDEDDEDENDEDENDDQEVPLGELILQGVKAAFVLAERLEPRGRYRVFASLDADEPSMVLRFFARREGEEWCSDDPEEFELQGVLMIDT